MSNEKHWLRNKFRNITNTHKFDKMEKSIKIIRKEFGNFIKIKSDLKFYKKTSTESFEVDGTDFGSKVNSLDNAIKAFEGDVWKRLKNSYTDDKYDLKDNANDQSLNL
ncbi:MAG: hypothetical protein RsTaC01_0757 [Candidatus Paraimprobicoccus trichonymphae]|uniref:Uncharacterized protein n=1 Tax=Candidatus Paraimprobicoccus trichonymphae TaxID=3033793 RepID=A0AA48KZG4_9FIRM|nr:MAG: hypothetical protein RsTaC01_0757 [Candidatus Paraimprobicoccus trichonymphae]